MVHIIKKIAVFVGTDCIKTKKDYYYPLAYQTGALLAQAGFVTVTGAGAGLMEEVTRGAYEHGGQTLGIALRKLEENQSKYLTELRIYPTLRVRQQELISVADGYIVLPGGIGTLYELSEVLALKKIGAMPKDKPLLLVDPFYRQFEACFQQMLQEGFINYLMINFFQRVKEVGSAVQFLQKTL